MRVAEVFRLGFRLERAARRWWLVRYRGEVLEVFPTPQRALAYLLLAAPLAAELEAAPAA